MNAVVVVFPFAGATSFERATPLPHSWRERLLAGDSANGTER